MRPVMLGFSRQEAALLRRLSSPKKIQDFLETLPFNFEKTGDTCFSPATLLKERRAHCMEGALFAAAALRFQKQRPLLLDLVAAKHDFDHVVALFRQYGCWGAISKTNHGVLRYREPVYRTIRELALSYFHEYFDSQGRKTLRTFSQPFDLSRFDRQGWMTSEGNLWDIPEALDASPHRSILTRAQLATLRRADPVERKMGEIVQWKK